MNRFKKYCPNVWVAECDEEYEKGDIIDLETKYGKEVPCEVFNLVAKNSEKFFYSVVRIEEKSYTQRKAEKYIASASRQKAKSNDYYKASQEGSEFLSLGQPILVGHHSEKGHRALLERNWNRMGNSVECLEKSKEAERKAAYWENKSTEITLAMPESIEYFTYKLEKAVAYHRGLKEGTIEREHSYSLTYASKEVKELKKKVEVAKLLWGDNEEHVAEI